MFSLKISNEIKIGVFPIYFFLKYYDNRNWLNDICPVIRFKSYRQKNILVCSSFPVFFLFLYLKHNYLASWFFSAFLSVLVLVLRNCNFGSYQNCKFQDEEKIFERLNTLRYLSKDAETLTICPSPPSKLLDTIFFLSSNSRLD